MIDIHAHLCFPDFDKDRDIVVAECEKEMTAVVVGSARHDEGLCALRLAKAHPKLLASIGYHPTEGGSDPGMVIDVIEKNRESVVAVGEVGLDYHWEKDARKRKGQEDVFLDFIRIASKLRKPIVIHSWDAEPECFELVRDFGHGVIFHCFSGTTQLAEEIIKRGFFISFSTQVLFSKNHRKLAKAVPLDNMLLETDSPFLSPYRYLQQKGEIGRLKAGFDPKKNYPWNISLSAAKIAEIKGVDIKEVISESTENAKRVLGLDA